MFGLFKSDPRKRIEKEYNRKLEEAQAAQRAGNIQEFARLTEEAEALNRELEANTPS